MSNAPRPPSSIPLLAALAAGLAGCYSPEPSTNTAAIDVGICTRNPAVLFGNARSCGDDAACPCGSYCDTAVGTCTYACMPPGTTMPDAPGTFPGDPSACDATGELCDDHGRCVSAGGPPGNAVELGAEPRTLTTVAGGAHEVLAVTLDLADPTPAETTASEATIVKVTGREGAKVACTDTTFVDECTLTDWQFEFTGQVVRATKPILVKTIAGTPESEGDVVLSIDVTAARLIVPAFARPAITNADGIYAGVVSPPGSTDGIEVRAYVRQNQILVRDPSRTIAPEGALLLDLRTSGTPAPKRKMVWIRGADAPATAANAGIIGEYGAGIAAVDFEAGAIEAPLDIVVPGTVGLTGWKLSLARIDEYAAECGPSAPCATGEVCEGVLQACVPSAVLTPTTNAVGNSLDDKRSADWWATVSPHLSHTVFNTTGAEVLEALACTVDAEHRGRYATTQIQRPAPETSRSGDLACIDGAPAHAPAPGVVGLATLLDRETVADDRKTPKVLEACLLDLKRLPATGASFLGAFGVTVGKCANLARFVPSMRLLASDVLGRGTAADLDPRNRGLLVRLTQQWMMLNAFVASAGVAQREADNVLDPTPASTVRTKLLEVFDAVDRNWSAVLDQRIAPAVTRAVGWSPTTRGDQSRDYRLVKQPIAYWTFNPVPNPDPNVTPSSRRHDLVRNIELMPNATATSVCAIGTTGGAFAQGFNCPGYTATVPPEAPSLVDDASLGGTGKIDNLTVTINVDARDTGGPGTGGSTSLVGDGANYCPQCPDDPPDEEDPDPTPPTFPPPYRGGTLLATPTFALGESVDPTTLVHSLVLVHPTATTPELITLSNTGELGWSPEIPILGSATISVIRDGARKQYTVMITRGSTTTEWTFPYTRDPAGRLDWVPERTIRVGAAGTLPAGHYWAPYRKSYGGTLDDVAVFDAALSKAEVQAFATARTSNVLRTVWPTNMSLQPAPAANVEDIHVPLGAQLLEAQVAQLELASRVMAAMADRAMVACDPAQSGAAAARAEVDAAVARAGRAVRQSRVVEGLAAQDSSTRANEARELLAAKRVELIRSLEPARCTAPFEMADSEIPLYHDSINPTWSETRAYFAGSDYFIGAGVGDVPVGIAEGAAREANAALEGARDAYVQYRHSQIQQAQEDAARAIRVEAIETQFGDGLRRLCGIAGLTNHEIVKRIHAPEPTDPPFYVSACYVDESPQCALQADLPLIDRDPACYRGQIGEQLMGVRSANLAFMTAHQQYETAIDNAKAARRFCIWKEMDTFGCAALDRFELSGVTCPAGHQGTVELVATYNATLNRMQRSRANMTFWMSWMAGTANGIAGKYSGSSESETPSFLPIAVVAVVVAAAAVKAGVDAWSAHKEATIDDRRRDHQAVLAQRSAEAEIVACWNQAEQYERAIQSAEDAATEAFGRFAAAGVGFDNATREADHIVLEAPAAMDRELTRPSIPFAFHYWLDERISTYERLFERAKRYTYIGLRATEYDLQRTFTAIENGVPQRAAVLAATHPQQLLDQLAFMRAQTGTRKVHGRSPALKWTAFDVGERLWGLPISSPLVGVYLEAYLRDVVSKDGEPMGRGLRFSLVPRNRYTPPSQRCAERIWRVAVGAMGFPQTDPGNMITKLIKRNVFASRRCNGGGTELQTAIWRPSVNLLVGGGDSTTFDEPSIETPADTPLVRLEDALDQFRNGGTPPTQSSTELSLQGLYGDYILLFPTNALTHGLVPHNLRDLNIRFDHISIDDTQATGLVDPGEVDVDAGADAEPFELQLDPDPAPIVVD